MPTAAVPAYGQKAVKAYWQQQKHEPVASNVSEQPPTSIAGGAPTQEQRHTPAAAGDTPTLEQKQQQQQQSLTAAIETAEQRQHLSVAGTAAVEATADMTPLARQTCKRHYQTKDWKRRSAATMT